MIVSSARATVGLVTVATPTSSFTSGAVQVGNSNVSLPITAPDSAYCLRAIFSAAAEVMTLNLLTGVTSASTAFIAGAAQVDTATAAGTVTVAGNASVVVTAAGMAGSPLTIPVAVLLADTAAMWAAKARGSLASNAAVSVMFSVSGSGTAISLTRKPVREFTLPVGTHKHYAANDATLNLALSTGTATGITTASTSADTTAGVLTSGVMIYDNAVDFEGVTIASLTPKAVLYALSDRGAEAGVGRVTVDGSGTDFHQVPANGKCLLIGNGTATLNIDTTVVVTSVGGFMDFSATVIR